MNGDTPLHVALHTLQNFAVLIAAGSLCTALARSMKIPDIVIFLLAGMAIGPEMFGLIDIPGEGALNQALLIFGACYLLFDGGASLRLSVLKEVWVSILIISTVGVLITGAITAATAYWVMGIPVMVALLLGATIASTDPATLVPIFKQVPIKDRVAQTVMSESAFNDAMGAIAVFAVLAVAMGGGEFSVGDSLYDLAYKAGIGAVVGLGLGFALVFLVAPAKIGLLQGYASVAKLPFILGAYLIAEQIGASGFMAVFMVGTIVGNKDVFGADFGREDEHAFDSFVSIFALIMRMFIFILLGSHVDFALMNQYLLGGTLVVVVFMLVARPLTVFICCAPDRRARWSLNELLFMCWTRETGVIPAALAGMLVGMNAPGAKLIASVTFIAILMTIVIQASTTPLLARKLGLLAEQQR